MKILLREIAMIAVIVLIAAAAWAERFPDATADYLRHSLRRVQSRNLFLLDLTVSGYYEDLLNARGSVRRSEARGQSTFEYSTDFLVYAYKPNLDIHHPDEGHLVTNRFGMPDREYTREKPPRTWRIALVGDSMARGFGHGPGQNFESMLEDRLNEGHRSPRVDRFEILNFSVAGYRAAQFLEVALNKVPGFQPDVCLLALTDITAFRGLANHLRILVRDGVDLKYDFLREAVSAAGIGRRDSQYEIQNKLAPFRFSLLRRILTGIRSGLRAKSIPVVVILVPAVDEPDLVARRFHGIARLTEEIGIPVVDLLDTFEKVRFLEHYRLARFDIHPDLKGHRLLYENLYRKLRERPALWSMVTGDASGR